MGRRGCRPAIGATVLALSSHDNRGKFVVEPGRIDVYAGTSSSADMTQSFTVQG